MAGGLVFDAASSNPDGTNPGTAVDVYDNASYKTLLDGLSWPAPQPTVQWASSVDTEGASPAATKHENRQITMTILCKTVTALTNLESKLTKIQREGGTLKWTLRDGTTAVIFDLLSVDTYEPMFDDGLYVSTNGTYCKVRMSLTAKPYGRGTEVTLSDHVETTLPHLVFTEASIAGDMPALGRLVVDNDVAATQALFVWGLQSRYYSSAATAALFYEAESCAMILAAAAVGPAGASGSGSNVAHMTTSGFTNVYKGMTYIGASSTAQTHIGTFRVLCRAQAANTNTGIVYMRCGWQPYIGSTTIYNDPVYLRDASNVAIKAEWVIVDLGEISIPKALVGNQGWLGQIEAASTASSDLIDLDWILLIPVDEGSGQSVSYASTGKPLIASGSIVVRYDGVFSSQAGGYWSSPGSYEGDYLTVPPSGSESRTLRVVCKLARGVTGSTITASGGPVHLDPNTDDISARLFVTPRYLVVPS